MARGPRGDQEFVALSDLALRSVIGPNSRHIALVENAFDVLIESPGGGVTITGSARERAEARRAVLALGERAEAGIILTETDVRATLSLSAGGKPGAANQGLISGRRGPIAPKTEAQAAYLQMLEHCDLTFGVGPAGTGKTFLAAAYGATLLLKGQVDRLVITRPAVEAGERLGFLPGDLNEKVDPYLAPIWEALDQIIGADAVRRRRDKGEIEVAPLAFMRGRTLAHAFVIVDEAQNTSRLQMKMVLTRLGEGARMVVTGDPSQVDLLNPRDSGLSHAIRLLRGVEGVGVSTFTAEDVVRHPLVARIVRAYDADAEARRPKPDLEDS
ncbi:MAG TPA: PhoH family protein [Brevundimonas sp.]|jgi:phosphate starvation-inducible PhoH-like protein|uniref:PhoH family protein n=1 Tax=Brevundimonas sp. TaxID=1871086 RepID=UPI002BD0CA03|nr:PhoH family protein [Brevundimonas sp.]HRH19089.1 PhoH family protein [Brevundimonas sp.]